VIAWLVSVDPLYDVQTSATPFAGLAPKALHVTLVPAPVGAPTNRMSRRSLPALCGAAACHRWSWIVAADGLPDASVAIENATIRALASEFAYVWTPSEKL